MTRHIILRETTTAMKSSTLNCWLNSRKNHIDIATDSKITEQHTHTDSCMAKLQFKISVLFHSSHNLTSHFRLYRVKMNVFDLKIYHIHEENYRSNHTIDYCRKNMCRNRTTKNYNSCIFCWRCFVWFSSSNWALLYIVHCTNCETR